LYKKKF